MIIKKTIIGLLLLFVIAFGADKVVRNGKKEINRELGSKRANAKIIEVNTLYQDSVNSESLVVCYKLSELKSENEYYFHLKNLGLKDNYRYNYVQFNIEDADGNVIKYGKLSATTGDSIYPFSPNVDGDIYIKFYSKYSVGYYSSNYEFRVKSSYADSLA